MRSVFLAIFTLLALSNCTMLTQNGNFANSQIQTINMGKLTGLRTIEIVALNFPESTSAQGAELFSELEKNNFSETLILSLKGSEVRVLPSAQTKLHLDFTLLTLVEGESGRTVKMKADVAISRNGIFSRNTLEITSDSMRTIGATKDSGVKMFILELGEWLREQSSFKR